MRLVDNPFYPATWPPGARIFNLPGLQLTDVYSHGPEELYSATGNLLASVLLGAANPPVNRLIEPMSGSGIYAGVARSVGFEGKIWMGEENVLLAVLQEQTLLHPCEVAATVLALLTELRSLAASHGLNLDKTLTFNCDDEGRLQAFADAADHFIRDRMKRLTQVNQHFVARSEGGAGGDVECAAIIWFIQALGSRDAELHLNRNGGNRRRPIRARALAPGLHGPRYRLSIRPFYADHLPHALENLATIFAGTGADGDRRPETAISHIDRWHQMRHAGAGDLVALSSRAAGPRRDREDFLTALGPKLQSAWTDGARIIICIRLNRAEADALNKRFRALGLSTFFQPALHARTGPVMVASARVPPVHEYLVAVNFDPACAYFSLLPPPNLNAGVTVAP